MNRKPLEVKVPVSYYSQATDACANLYSRESRAALKNRQFEWTSCGEYHDEVETGLVGWELDSEYLPVALGGKKTANRGVVGENFQRWFKPVDGLNTFVSGEFRLKEKNGNYSFSDMNFHPVEGLFTMHFGFSFNILANGQEEFEITADDDTFVFVGNKLVIDMGGVHSKTTGKFIINEDAEIYAGVGDEGLAYTGVNLNNGEMGIIRVFHANRDSKSSALEVKISGMVLNTTTNKDGVMEVQYNPANPGYMAPLGETLTVGFNQEKIMATTNNVKILSFGAIGVFAALIIYAGLKYWRRGHNREE